MASVGCFGKIPAQGDFVRVNAADPICIAFDQWLAEGIDGMQRTGAALPNEPVFFVFRAPPNKTALVGAFAPSVDSVGRQYPLVIFAITDVGTIAPRFPGVPVVYSGFLAAAAQLVGQAPRMTSQRLNEQVRAMSVPVSNDFATGDAVCRRTLDETRSADVQRRLFGDPNVGKQFYAVRTFLNACDAARGKEPAKTNVTLECPIGADVDLFMWLELARRALRWNTPPSFCWTEGTNARLLLPVGPAPPALLSYLALRDRAGNRLWPVVTERADAIQTAHQQLAANARRALEEVNGTLETMLASVVS